MRVLRLWLLISIVFGFAFQANAWEYTAAPEIEGGLMVKPQDQTVDPYTPAVVRVMPGSNVNCEVTAASDKDTWTTVSSDGEDDDTVKYKWTASGGGFVTATHPNGDADFVESATAQWKAPNVPGDYTLTCKIDDTPKAVTGSDTGTRDDDPVTRTVTVRVIGIEKLEYRIGGQGAFADVPSPLVVPMGSSVDFQAVSAPTGADWPTGKPAWGGTSGATGTGATKTVTFNTLSTSLTDYKTVTAQCGTIKTANVIAVKVEMANPTGDPTKSAEATENQNEFTFNSASPGVLTIQCRATLTPDNAITQAWAKENVSWEVSDIAGSTESWTDTVGAAADNKGKEVNCRFTTLPSNNAAFGLKTVTMTVGDEDTERNIEVFYSKWATNHPVIGGTQADTPNWYYYWSQTTANSGTHTYDATINTGLCLFNNVVKRWVVKIGPAASNYTYGGTWNNAKGIDLFANLCRHEAQHKADLSAQWGVSSGVISGQDIDGDYLRYNPAQTPQPADRETTVSPPQVSGHYDPMIKATFADLWNYNAMPGKLNDVEHYCLGRQPGWTKGNANNEDWGNEGMQHKTNGNYDN